MGKSIGHFCDMEKSFIHGGCKPDRSDDAIGIGRLILIQNGVEISVVDVFFS